MSICFLLKSIFFGCSDGWGASGGGLFGGNAADGWSGGNWAQQWLLRTTAVRASGGTCCWTSWMMMDLCGWPSGLMMPEVFPPPKTVFVQRAPPPPSLPLFPIHRVTALSQRPKHIEAVERSKF